MYNLGNFWVPMRYQTFVYTQMDGWISMYSMKEIYPSSSLMTMTLFDLIASTFNVNCSVTER